MIWTPPPDVECPYCGTGQDICHDDGYGYEEDELHEQECGNCEKTFVFTTSIHFYYDARKADCLNGADHKMKPTPHFFWHDSKTCEDCGYEERGKFDQEGYDKLVRQQVAKGEKALAKNKK